MRSGPRTTRRAAALTSLLVVIIGAVVPMTAAGADEISDKQAEANAIAAKIEELDHTIERYAEAANGAQLELDSLEQQVADAQAKVAAAQAERDQHRAEIRAYAIDAYVHGTTDESLATSAGADLTTMGMRQGYLSAAAGNRQSLVDQLRATEEDVNLQIEQLNKSQAEAAAKKRDLDGQKAAAQSAAAQQKQLYDKAKGELATLVKAAQERKAAEQAAAAQAKARSRALPDSGGPTAGPPPSVNGGASAAIAEARKQVGKPYVWGAAGPNSFDCSGLTMWAWRAGGVSLPHFSGAQYAATTHIPLSQIQPGDLIFYESPHQHVALYIGGGQIIQAINSNRPVEYNSLYFWDTAMYASRPG